MKCSALKNFGITGVVKDFYDYSNNCAGRWFVISFSDSNRGEVNLDLIPSIGELKDDNDLNIDVIEITVNSKLYMIIYNSHGTKILSVLKREIKSAMEYSFKPFKYSKDTILKSKTNRIMPSFDLGLIKAKVALGHVKVFNFRFDKSREQWQHHYFDNDWLVKHTYIIDSNSIPPEIKDGQKWYCYQHLVIANHNVCIDSLGRRIVVVIPFLRFTDRA